MFFSYIIDYQHVSIASAVIIKVKIKGTAVPLQA